MFIMKDIILFGLLIGGVVLALFLYFKYFKLLKIKNIVFVDGSLGTGKTVFSVNLAVRLIKRAKRRYYIKRFVFRVLAPVFKRFEPKLNSLEEPLLYSSILLRNIPFVKITKDMFLRTGFRFAYGSVVLLDEFSLIADQMTYKNRDLNERLTLFFKLFRHETKGGYLIINSQSVQDIHYSLKYVLSDYIYIHHKTRFPFVTALRVQEMKYCADKNGNQIVNANENDLEESLKTILFFNRYYKYYDTYCYSIFTDMLPVYHQIETRDKDDDLKDKVLVSFKEYQYLLENFKENNK